MKGTSTRPRYYIVPGSNRKFRVRRQKELKKSVLPIVFAKSFLIKASEY